MYLGEYKEEKIHKRTSKLGITHEYTRIVTLVTFRCDSCGESFTRPRGNMSPKRLSDRYFHVCSNCDAKRFAQKKGVERRLIWDMPVSSLVRIGRL